MGTARDVRKVLRGRPHLARLLPLAIIVLSAAALLPLLLRSGSPSTHADSTGPRMALDAEGAGIACDIVPQPSRCSVPLGAAFTLAVDVVAGPGEGYVAFQTEVFYGGLTYQPATLAEEIVWPQSALPVRSPSAPGGQERLVAHADASATMPPFPVSTHTGRVVQIVLTCPPAQQRFTAALLPYDASSRLLGAGFRSAASDGGAGQTVPAKAAGQAELDLDGDGTAELVNVADTLEIDCGGGTPSPADTSTPTEAPAGTPTRTPTPPGRTGDVNCSGAVNSLDAALVLQFGAGLARSLRCLENADVNADGRIDSIDAALILQFDAGLLRRLPPA